MRLVTVYRMENERGEGPYSDSNVQCLYHHNGSTKHPTPTAYGEPFSNNMYMGVDQKMYVCGFTSRRQLNSWFTEEERGELQNLGYTVKVYNMQSTDVIRGKRQCVFRNHPKMKCHKCGTFTDVHKTYCLHYGEEG